MLVQVIVTVPSDTSSGTLVKSTTGLTTVQVNVCSEALPAASSARTESVWMPTSSPWSTTGEVHGAYAAPSSEHSSSVAPSATNANVASPATVVAAGRVTAVITGCVASYCTVSWLDAALPLPAASLAPSAATSTVTEPSLVGVTVNA